LLVTSPVASEPDVDVSFNAGNPTTPPVVAVLMFSV
jgi:hypothetical protein